MEMMETSKWLLIFIIISLLSNIKLDEITCDTVQNGRISNHHIRCQGEIAKTEALQDVLAHIHEPIEVFELFNASIVTLPDDIFGNATSANVKKVIFSRLTIDFLSPPEKEIFPFLSLANKLESFEVYESNLAFAWNFSALSTLKLLKSVIFEDTDIFTVEDYLKLFPKLRFIQIINCKIRWVHKEAFQKNPHLSICSLSHNFIETVTRSMFPNPALHLWSIDLSYNKLKTLPKNIFEHMNSLQVLKLDHNHLEINGDVFKRVWNDLTEFWLDGNDMICWQLCPLLKGDETGNRPQFFNSSRCVLPPKIKKLLDSFDC